MEMIATLLGSRYVGVARTWPAFALPPAIAGVLVYGGFYFGGLTMLSVVGLRQLMRRWQSGSLSRDAPSPKPPAPTLGTLQNHDSPTEAITPGASEATGKALVDDIADTFRSREPVQPGACYRATHLPERAGAQTTR
jgi:hypothetical protein